MNRLKRERMEKKIILVFAIIIIVVSIISNFGNLKEKNKTLPTVTLETKSETEEEIEENPYHIEKKVFYEKGKILSKHTTTNSASYGNRNVNLKVAAQIINTKQKNKKRKIGKGYLLKPNETFSWFDVIGEPTLEKGFKYAPQQVNGNSVDGIAGGYCENGISLNTSAIEAGLDTIGQPHKKTPGYVVEGYDIDVTISYDSGINFKVVNTLNFPVIFVQKAKGGSVTTIFYKAKKVVKYMEY